MREDLLKEVFLDLQSRQMENEATEKRRRQEIRDRFPDIEKMMERRETMIQDAMAGILQGKRSAEDLPDQVDRISAGIRAALKAEGYAENYLSPVYTCPLCRDTGYTGDKIRQKCACVERRYQEKLRRLIGLPEDGRETFAQFDEKVFPVEKLEGSEYSQREMMNLVRSQCEAWAEQFPNQSPRDMILSGKSGLGKTFLLHAMASRLIERGVHVLLLSAYSFLEIARRSYFENDGQLEELIGAEVLMLDDLGSEPLMQNITIEQLFNLINERQRRNLPTVISTNLNREELRSRYTERILSRLTDRRSCNYLYLRGRDIRNGRV